MIHLPRPKIYFFYGNDLNLISERIKEVSQDISEANKFQLNIEKVELNKIEDIESFISQGSNIPLFSQNSLLQIYLGLKKNQLDEELLFKFLFLVNSISSKKYIIIVLYLEKYEKSTQKSISETNLVKELKNIAISEEFVKLRFWQIEEIKNRINQIATNYDLKFENDSLNLFVDCFREEIEYIPSELQKIHLYLLPNNLVTKQVINDLYMSGYNIDDLYSQVVSKKSFSFVHLTEELIKLKSPLYLIATLQNKLRQALEIKIYSEDGKNVHQISKLLSIHSYKLEKEIKQLKNISSSDLRNLIFWLSDIEFKIKNGIIKDQHALDMLFIRSKA